MERKTNNSYVRPGTPEEAVKSILCLWATLTCPSEEAWLELIEDVIHSQDCGCHDDLNPIWRIIIEHMRDSIGEA